MANIPLSSQSPVAEAEASPIKITDFEFDLSRARLRKPLGFKGAEFSEKWVCRVSFTGGGGSHATAYGGDLILVFLRRRVLGHREGGGQAPLAAADQVLAPSARPGGQFTPPRPPARIRTPVP